jgi:hypothetical protein
MKQRIAMALVVLIAAAPPALAGEKTVTLDGLKSDLPASWKMQEPSNKFRAYQALVPKATGDKEDAELVIFYFGAG